MLCLAMLLFVACGRVPEPDLSFNHPRAAETTTLLEE